MKLNFKKLALMAILFSSSAFSFHSQSYICYSASGNALFGGNSPIAQIPTIRLVCESVGGNLV